MPRFYEKESQKTYQESYETKIRILKDSSIKDGLYASRSDNSPFGKDENADHQYSKNFENKDNVNDLGQTHRNSSAQESLITFTGNHLENIKKTKGDQENKDVESEAEKKKSIIGVMENEIMEDIFKKNKLMLTCQEKVKAFEGTKAGMEILLRVMDKEGIEILPTQDFIENAEKDKNPLTIQAITTWIINEACKRGKTLYESKFLNEDNKMSINLSSKQVNSYLALMIKKIIDNYNIPSNLFEFEFTETYEVKDINEQKLQIYLLKECGFDVAFDDVGSKYHSVDRILPFGGIADTLKIGKDDFDILFKNNSSRYVEIIRESVKKHEYVNYEYQIMELHAKLKPAWESGNNKKIKELEDQIEDLHNLNKARVAYDNYYLCVLNSIKNYGYNIVVEGVNQKQIGILKDIYNEIRSNYITDISEDVKKTAEIALENLNSEAFHKSIEEAYSLYEKAKLMKDKTILMKEKNNLLSLIDKYISYRKQVRMADPNRSCLIVQSYEVSKSSAKPLDELVKPIPKFQNIPL